jgi:hypothetical protein
VASVPVVNYCKLLSYNNNHCFMQRTVQDVRGCKGEKTLHGEQTFQNLRRVQAESIVTWITDVRPSSRPFSPLDSSWDSFPFERFT